MNKPNQNSVSFTCSHCVGGFGTCGGSRRYGFVLFTTEVCVRSSIVFCIETIWSNVNLYRIDFTFVTNLLRFVSKRLVSKRLCIETTVNRSNDISFRKNDLSLSSNDISLSSNDILLRENDNSWGAQRYIGDISRLLEQWSRVISPIYRSNGNIAQIWPISRDYHDKRRYSFALLLHSTVRVNIYIYIYIYIWKNTRWLIIIKRKESARIKCKNNLFKPCIWSK